MARNRKMTGVLEMTISNLFSLELIESDLDFASQEELFDEAFAKLTKLDLVTENFLTKIIEREKKYPTGLKTHKGAVAIPHTDPEYVKESFIYVMRLTQPLEFNEMGTSISEGKIVTPKLIFMIGFEKGKQQPEILKALTTLFSSTEQMSAIVEATDNQEVYDLLKKYVK